MFGEDLRYIYRGVYGVAFGYREWGVMSKVRGIKKEKLSVQQRAIVEQYLYLVEVQIKKSVGKSAGEAGDWVYDDLFQEACCGLIRAVREYEDDCPVPFPAYALGRIRNAISVALAKDTLRADCPDQVVAGNWRRAKRRASGKINEKVYIRDTRTFDWYPGKSLIGFPLRSVADRFREKYEAALELAVKSVINRRTPRSNRAAIVKRLVSERLLIPAQSYKTSLRTIARCFRTTYSRVQKCEKSLMKTVGRLLADDPEFNRLAEMIFLAEPGSDLPINCELERDLKRLAVQGIDRHLLAMDPENRRRAVVRIIEKYCIKEMPESVIRQLVERLPSAETDSLLLLTSEVGIKCDQSVKERKGRRRRTVAGPIPLTCCRSSDEKNARG